MFENQTHERKYAAISASSAAGPFTLVAAVTGKRIRVINYVLNVTAAVTAQFKSGDTVVSGAMEFAAKSTVSSAAVGVDGLFQTDAGVALTLVVGGSTAIAGHLCYIEV
jgi:hypothetical protein